MSSEMPMTLLYYYFFFLFEFTQELHIYIIYSPNKDCKKNLSLFFHNHIIKVSVVLIFIWLTKTFHNIFFFVQKVIPVWNDIRVSKWWHNLKFWVNNPFNDQITTLKSSVPSHADLDEGYLERRGVDLCGWYWSYSQDCASHALLS